MAKKLKTVLNETNRLFDEFTKGESDEDYEDAVSLYTMHGWDVIKKLRLEEEYAGVKID